MRLNKKKKNYHFLNYILFPFNGYNQLTCACMFVRCFCSVVFVKPESFSVLLDILSLVMQKCLITQFYSSVCRISLGTRSLKLVVHVTKLARGHNKIPFSNEDGKSEDGFRNT